MKKVALTVAMLLAVVSTGSSAILRREVTRHTVVSRPAVRVPLLQRGIYRTGCGSEVVQSYYRLESGTCTTGSCGK
jgi:hypothetical protein